MSGKMILPQAGERYGRWTVIRGAGFIEREKGRKRAVALCKCDCGTVRRVSFVSIRTGASKSCGCLAVDATKKANTKHGLKKHPAYNLYGGVYDRCYNPKSTSYERYGGRGVQMCAEWKGSPDAFVRWAIDNGWRKDLQIDRKDNNASYSPENCRFVTPRTNCQNRRTSRVWVIDGLSFDSARDAGDHFGISQDSILRWCGRKSGDGKPPRNRPNCYSYPKYPESKEDKRKSS